MPLRLSDLLILALLLLSSCQGSRPAFYFGARPVQVPHKPVGPAAATVAAPPDSALAASPGAAPEVSTGSPAAAKQKRRRATPQAAWVAPTRRSPASAVVRVAGQASRVVGQRVVQPQHPRNTADFDPGKALGETILAALYLVGLIGLLVVLLSASTATGQLVWGIAFGVAASPLLYWLGRLVAALIRSTGNTRRHRRGFVSKQVRQPRTWNRHPTKDSWDKLIPFVVGILSTLTLLIVWGLAALLHTSFWAAFGWLLLILAGLYVLTLLISLLLKVFRKKP